MVSLWSDSVSLPERCRLEGDLRTDVLIIGGGMAGILCAHFLRQEGIDYALVESDRIGSGITGNTTAKITSQHGLIYDRLIRSYGKERAGKYLHANQWAVDQYAQLCREIDCGFEYKDAYIYSLSDRKSIQQETKAAEKLGMAAVYTELTELPFRVAGAVKFPAQAQFHPMKFISGLATGLNIYEHTVMREMGDHWIATDKGKVYAKAIIVATHFPVLNKHGSYFLKMYQHRSYVLALKNAANVKGMYLEERKNGISLRNYEDLLLIGGGDHRTGHRGGNWQELRRFAGKYYPAAEEKYHWAAQDCMSLDGIPYIGHYSRNTPDLYVATGFNKWGMTSAMIAAKLLTEQLAGRKNEYAEVFSPSRSILKPQLLINGIEAVGNLVSFSKKRCPHLGCALKWNVYERTWDCPCHGSRFSEYGRVLDNPANGNMK